MAEEIDWGNEISLSNKKSPGCMDERMDGRKSCFKDCLQQSKNLFEISWILTFALQSVNINLTLGKSGFLQFYVDHIKS